MNNQTLWAMAQLYIAKDLSVPADLLAEADNRGLMLTEFDQPKLNPSDKGDSHYGNFQEELYDWQDHLGLQLSDPT